MAKLVALSKLVAEVAGLSPARIRVLEMVLRKAGLITTGGRGLHAAEMKPSDAANLTLGALHQGAVTEADAGVRQLRELEIVSLRINNFDSEIQELEVPTLEAELHLPFGMPSPKNLGEALDWLFSSPTYLVGEYSDIELSQIGSKTQVTLSISEPGWYEGCHFSTEAKCWSLSFLSFSSYKGKYDPRRTTRFINPGLLDIAKLIVGEPV